MSLVRAIPYSRLSQNQALSFLSCVPSSGAAESTFFCGICQYDLCLILSHSLHPFCRASLRSPIPFVFCHFPLSHCPCHFSSQGHQPCQVAESIPLPSLLNTVFQTTGILHYLGATDDLFTWLDAKLFLNTEQHNVICNFAISYSLNCATQWLSLFSKLLVCPLHQ